MAIRATATRACSTRSTSDDDYGLKSLFDSLHPAGAKGKHWYEKLSIRGYTQFRFGRTLDQDPDGADPILLGDRSINGNAENFSIRRARLILFGDVSDHLCLYFQPDFAITPPGSSTATFFAQLRDLYGDVYVDKEKVHRFRVGLSKVPYGWENMQSSQNRVPLDRTDPINTAVSPERAGPGRVLLLDPGGEAEAVPGPGGRRAEGVRELRHLRPRGVQRPGRVAARAEPEPAHRRPAHLAVPARRRAGGGGQRPGVHRRVRGRRGRRSGRSAGGRPSPRPGPAAPRGFRDQRIAGTFVWYPQPFGFQAEWNVGEGPGLNDAQTAVEVRSLQGGYVMAMYKLDTARCGIFTPYARYQHYRGGYRSVANAPYGNHDQWDLGVEWQIRKEMELVAEYSFVDGVNLNAINEAGVTSYQLRRRGPAVPVPDQLLRPGGVPRRGVAGLGFSGGGAAPMLGGPAMTMGTEAPRCAS